jgi:hypothetical protein
MPAQQGYDRKSLIIEELAGFWCLSGFKRLAASYTGPVMGIGTSTPKNLCNSSLIFTALGNDPQ